MKVEIYNHYSEVYQNKQTNELTPLVIQWHRGEKVDENLYTLVHPSSAFQDTEATDLTREEALAVVEDFYNIAKATGTSCTDRNVRLDEGYAEVDIVFSNGKRLNRVIYMTE